MELYMYLRYRIEFEWVLKYKETFTIEIAIPHLAPAMSKILAQYEKINIHFY